MAVSEEQQEQYFIDGEIARALKESKFSVTKITLILGISRFTVGAYVLGFVSPYAYKKRCAAQLGFGSVFAMEKYRVRQKINPMTGRPFSGTTEYEEFLANQAGFPSESAREADRLSQRINPETGEPFGSAAEYRAWYFRKAGVQNQTAYEKRRVRKKINPDTGRPFESIKEYNDYFAVKQGFASHSEREMLMRDPAVLVIDALRLLGSADMPAIYLHIKETRGLEFNAEERRLEKAIEQANWIQEEPLFIALNGRFSLNMQNAVLEEMLGEEEANSDKV